MIKATDIKVAAEAMARNLLGELEADIDKTLSKMAIFKNTRTAHKITLEQYDSLSHEQIWSLLNEYRNNGWRVEPEEFSTIGFIHPDDPDYNRDYTKCPKCQKKLFTVFGINTGQCLNATCPDYFFRM